jgi:hypothetical protein
MANPSQPAPAQTAAKAELPTRKCSRHDLQLAPDGLCALCRRERNAISEASSGSSFIGTVVFGALALIGIGVVSYWYLHPDKMPGEAVVREGYKGPSIEDRIAAVDDQLAELRAMQKAGDLDAGGLHRISQLEQKRSAPVAVYDAQKDN